MEQGRLKEVLRYEPTTGEFFWKQKTGRGVVVGRKAGAKRPDGYITIQVDRVQYLGHHLAWLYVYGVLPEMLDHIDRARGNNAIENLHLATDGENKQNVVSARAHNKSSGLLGVSRSESKSKPWTAQIRLAGKVIWLGRHETKDAAQRAYTEAKSKLHPFSPKHV